MNAEDGIVRRGVVGVVVRKGRFLTIRRSRTVVAAGKICFPGGGIERSESDEAALVREMREELNVTIRPIRLLWQSVTSWRVALSWWLTALDDDAIPLPNPAEVESIAWYSPHEMSQMEDLLESNQSFLDALRGGEFDPFASQGTR